MSGRGYTAIAGVCSVALGVRLPSTPAETPARAYWLLFIAAGLLVLWGLVAFRPGRRERGRSAGGRLASVARSAWSSASWDGASSAARVERLQEKSRRNSGLASGWSVLRHASGWALRRRAGVLRPSLAGRWFVRAIEVGTPLAKVGRLLRVWSPCEDVTLRVGGPRTGKSGELACRILDAPGAVIATSTRTDLYNLCGPVLRGEPTVSLVNPLGATVALAAGTGLWLVDVVWWASLVVALMLLGPVSMLCSPKPRAPRPVLVFNPSGTGGLASTVAFDPLVGCEVAKTAIERAGDLIQGASLGSSSGSDERKFWSDQARRALAALMHAAALSGASMRHVQSWLSDPDEHAATVERALRRSPSRALEQDAIQFFSTNRTTRSSITTTAMPALAWLADETAAASTEADEGRQLLDVKWLLSARAAVFMIGAEEAQTAPLLTALTAHIAREARRIAALAPGGRLDPPLTFALDEAALICTPPLERWTADMGGLGATIHIGVQSFAQLVGKYGQAGAATILNNTGTLMVFGGTRSPDDLNIYATLIGERETDAPTWDMHRRRQSIGTRMEPVLAKSAIAGLPKFHALIIRKEMLPMVGRVGMAWKRPEVVAVKRAARWEAELDAIAEFDRASRAFATAAGQAVDARLAQWRSAVRRTWAGWRAKREVTARQRRARDRGL